RRKRLTQEVDELTEQLEQTESEERPSGATEADVVQSLRAQRTQVRRELEQCRRDAASVADRLAELNELSKNERLDDLDPDTLRLRALEAAGNDSEEAEQCQRLIELLAEWHARFGAGPDFEAATLVRSQVVAATCVGLGSIRAIETIEFDL